MKEACIFCRIVSQTAPSWKVYGDEHSYAFLDRGQATRGHTLVVPRIHAADIWDIPKARAGKLMETVHEVAKLLNERLRPDGMTLFQANKEAGWQDVFHMHIHVVPRYNNDSLVLPWKAIQGKASSYELDEVLNAVTSSQSEPRSPSRQVNG